MKQKRLLSLILIVAALLSCFTVMASANSIARATGRFSITVEPGKLKKTSTTLPLDVDDEVTIKASFSPYNGRVDVGLIDENGLFHYVTVTGGSIDIAIAVPAKGNYTFAVRNTGTSDVSIDGYIKY